MIRLNTAYKIRELSARAVMRNARLGEDGVYTYSLSEEATLKCISPSAPETQDDCALFYQIMCVLHGEDFTAYGIIPDLADILIYMDFSRIFDRRPTQKKYRDSQKQAEDMFRPQGITLDFGRGPYRYVAFERSASMGRNSRLSFIREDFCAPVRERIMVGMKIGLCQLSKLYAYNGLMLTSGTRIEDMDIWDAGRVVVVDNPVSVVPEAEIITVEDDGTENPMRKYRRVEALADVPVTQFDGEGLISTQYADFVDRFYCRRHIHSSFQIRMPYIKGMVHEVDYKAFFRELGVGEITDVWGVVHPIDRVDLILTKSMFKGFGWMTENGLTWPEYLGRCRQYRHALYISEVGKSQPEKYTELNYQFLTTAAIRPEEFRPADLPLGWDHAPEEDGRDWITKWTESMYYHYAADEEYQLFHFTSALDRESARSKNILWAKVLTKNPLFLNELVFTKELDAQAEKYLKQYALGHLVTFGDNRYLSGDLLRFLLLLVRKRIDDGTALELTRECLKEGEVYAPGAAYARNSHYTLLRNPHIARNEEAVAKPPEEIGYFRQKYLSHLHYVVMVDSLTLIPERLGGADFDGDMIKTVADPLVNTCIARNYNGGVNFDYISARLPVLKIPSAEPLIRDAEDWQARFEAVRSTFDTRIGQICNAAFDRSIVAYNEALDEGERKRLREETEVLEILAGLEIDSAKSGVKPELSEYLGRRLVSRSPFLTYKNIVRSREGREWYEPTQREKLEKFFASVDWDSISANVEKLPWLARKLEKNTPKLKPKPAKDEELFVFARKKGWKDELDPAAMEFTASLIGDYESALRRIRVSRLEAKSMTRRRDVERILFLRGQENTYTADELYGVLQDLSAEHVARVRHDLTARKWQLMDAGKREDFLLGVIPYFLQEEYLDIFADFRKGGYRILGDIICDLDDLYKREEMKKGAIHRTTDSALMNQIMSGYERGMNRDYRDLAAARTREYLNGSGISPDLALKCAVALGKRSFVFDVLLDRVEANAIKRRRR